MLCFIFSTDNSKSRRPCGYRVKIGATYLMNRYISLTRSAPVLLALRAIAIRQGYEQAGRADDTGSVISSAQEDGSDSDGKK